MRPRARNSGRSVTHGQPEREDRGRWRLQDRFERSRPGRRWFATLAGIVGGVAIWRGMWLLMDLYVFPASPGLSGIVGIAAGAALLLSAGWSLEDAA